MQHISKYKIYFYFGTLPKTPTGATLSKIQTNRRVRHVSLGFPNVTHIKELSDMFVGGRFTPGTYATYIEIQDVFLF